MLSLVLAASLAAAPTPRAAASASTVVHIPRLTALQSVTSFLEKAGQSAALLRPDAWLAELHPFVPVDPRQPDALTRAGIDPEGALTLSLRDAGRVSCTRLSDPKLFQEKATAALLSASSKLKAVKPTTSAGVTSVLVARDSGGTVGYALKGQEACAFASNNPGFVDDGQGEALRKEAARLVGLTPRAEARFAALPGVVYLSRPGEGLAVALEGGATGLSVEGTSTRLPLPAFQPASASPYGTLEAQGLLFSRAHFAPAGVTDAMGALRALLQRVCTTCPRAELTSLSRAVAERLTGHVVMAVEGVRPQPDLRSNPGRFFATRQALAAELTDAAAVRGALAPLGKFPGARALEDGHALDVPGGTLFVRLQGRQLVLGNDASAAQTLLSSLTSAGAGALPHGVDFSLDPRKLAGALKQVSLMDVVADKGLAAAFTAGLELGPVLARSERIAGWLDSAPGGGHRFSARWTLPAQKE